MEKLTNKYHTIQMKLMIISLVVLIVPPVILGFLSYQKSTASLNELGETNLKNSVEMTIEMIEVLNEEVDKGNLSLEDAQEQLKTAILGEKKEDGTRSINGNIDLGENGYIFILDQEGNQVADPYEEGINVWDKEDKSGKKFVQEIIETGNSGGGLTYYDWSLPDSDQIERKVTFTKTDPYWGWTINASTYMVDFNKSAKGIRNIVLITIGISVVVGMILARIFLHRFSMRIQTVTEQMNLLANGDLTLKDLSLTSRDETGHLAEAMNVMKWKIEGVISDVTNASENLSVQSEELSQSAEEVKLGSEQIAVTMQELASASESQANHTNELSSDMQVFFSNIEEINGNSKQIQSSSTSVLKMTDEGSQLLNSSMEQMVKIDQIVLDAVQKMEGLDTQSQEISVLVGFIQDIAEQTNLLALNASIEAARAGEQGRGFAVVAEEVGKLAEQVSNSVTEITSIVENIQNESSTVSNSLQIGYKEVEHGTSQLKETSQKFHEIFDAVTGVGDGIESAYEHMSEIAAVSQQMNSRIQEIAATFEESAAGVEQTSALSQQTSSAMEEVAGRSHDLAVLAEKLNESVMQFKR